VSAALYGVVTIEERYVAGSVEEVYLRYAQDLASFATGLVGPWDAQDVVAEALMACVICRTWSGVGDPRSYLYRAVLNRCRQLARARVRRHAREHLASGRPSSSQDTELRSEVWDAVRRLSVRQRAVVVLTYWEDLTVGQVAERLALSEGSVHRHLARARSRLREVLDDDRS
jgi:RNA polymerase sigma factor (sigma-70 family)